MKMRKHGWIAAGAVLMLLFHTSPGYPKSGNPEESLDAATLRNELRQLKEKVKELEDRLTEMEAAGAESSGVVQGTTPASGPEKQFAPAEKPEASSSPVSLDRKGLFVQSADGDFQMKLRGYLQMDSRFYKDKDVSDDTFLLRRVRPILEGTVFDYYDYRIMPDFTGGSATLFDAYLDVHYWPEARLRIGKFKPPVGLERLQSPLNISFPELGLPTSLVPNRDIGIQLHGEVFDGALTYAVGIFNGVKDGGNGDLDDNDGKDFEARLFAHPFTGSEIDALKGLGFGLAGTYGGQEGALPAYKSIGQSQYFSYNKGAIADGSRSRISPQGYYYWGPFGLLGEYVLSSQEVALNGLKEEFDNDAWQIQATYVLTGENASYDGVKPKKPFSLKDGTWGSLEVAARYGQLEVDADVFRQGFADLAQSAAKAEAMEAGLNWYLNGNVQIKTSLAHIEYSGGGANGSDREDEDVIFTRFQIGF